MSRVILARRFIRARCLLLLVWDVNSIRDVRIVCSLLLFSLVYMYLVHRTEYIAFFLCHWQPGYLAKLWLSRYLGLLLHGAEV